MKPTSTSGVGSDRPDAFLRRERQRVDAAIARILQARAHGAARQVYDMQRYFFGYLDARFKPQAHPVGKRFRSALCLYLADAYGDRDAGLDAALAIELFHTVSLLYDDIQDHDEYRRGRKTVWKLWGVADALNAGGAEVMLVAQLLTAIAQQKKVGAQLADVLIEAFLAMWEGQHLDLRLAESPISAANVNEKMYLRMIGKKTATLIAASTQCAGIAARQSTREVAQLRDLGVALGIAYQIADDHASLWASRKQTGKDAHGDVRQHKRTYPFIWAYAHCRPSDKVRLKALYSLPRPLSRGEVSEALRIIEGTGARDATRAAIAARAKKAARAAEALHLPEHVRRQLSAYALSPIPAA